MPTNENLNPITKLVTTHPIFGDPRRDLHSHQLEGCPRSGTFDSLTHV